MVLGHHHGVKIPTFHLRGVCFSSCILFHGKQYLVIVGEGFSRLSFFQVLHASSLFYVTSHDSRVWLLYFVLVPLVICSLWGILCFSRLESFHIVSFSPLSFVGCFVLSTGNKFSSSNKEHNTLENEKWKNYFLF